MNLIRTWNATSPKHKVFLNPYNDFKSMYFAFVSLALYIIERMFRSQETVNVLPFTPRFTTVPYELLSEQTLWRCRCIYV